MIPLISSLVTLAKNGHEEKEGNTFRKITRPKDVHKHTSGELLKTLKQP